MKAVILAAGRGTRMPEITKNKPKCLIEINKKTVLEGQIEILLKYSIEEIYIVVGYKSDRTVEKTRNIKEVKLIENKDYAITDNIYSLYLTKDFVGGKEFILLNGDTVFDEEIIKKLANKKEKNIIPVDSKHYDLEELKVRKVRENNGLIVEILPKNAPQELSDGSTIGIFKFSSRGSKLFFDAIEKYIKGGTKNKWFGYALNKILPRIKMYKMNIHGYRWIEIDTLEDVEKAKGAVW